MNTSKNIHYPHKKQTNHCWIDELIISHYFSDNQKPKN